MPFAYQRQLRFTVLANIKKGGFIITELPLIQLLAEFMIQKICLKNKLVSGGQFWVPNFGKYLNSNLKCSSTNDVVFDGRSHP